MPAMIIYISGSVGIGMANRIFLCIFKGLGKEETHIDESDKYIFIIHGVDSVGVCVYDPISRSIDVIIKENL